MAMPRNPFLKQQKKLKTIQNKQAWQGINYIMHTQTINNEKHAEFIQKSLFNRQFRPRMQTARTSCKDFFQLKFLTEQKITQLFLKKKRSLNAVLV